MSLRLLVVALCLTAQGCGLGGLVGGLVATSLDKGSGNDAAPPPTISAASPNSGSHAGGTQITITGTNFSALGDQVPQVSVGGTSASSVVVQDGTRLTAVVPPSTTVGPVAVQVTSPSGGTATLPSGFTYTNELPVVTITTLTSPQSQNVVFTVTLADPESDPIDLRFYVSKDGGPWQAIPNSQILSGGTSDLASAHSGVSHNLTWDSRSVFDADNAQVRLRALPVDTSDGMEGTPGESNEFTITNNTPVDVTLIQPGADSFEVVFSYAVTDPDASDPVQVTALTYRDVNTGATGPMTLKAGQLTGGVPFSANGVFSGSVWDSLADLGFGNNRLVELTVTVSDGTFSRSRTTQSFFVHNGPLSHPTSVSTTLLTPNYAYGDVASAARKLTHGSVTGGPFVNGETITGAASARTARIDRVGDGYVLIHNEDGAFFKGELITGSSSGASASLTALAGFLPFPDVVACSRENKAPGRVSVSRSHGVGFDSPEIFLAPNIPGLPVPGSSSNVFLSGYARTAECAILDVDGDGMGDLVAASHALFDSVSSLLTMAAADAGTGFSNVRAHQVALQAKQVGGRLRVSQGTYTTTQAAHTAIAPHIRVAGQAASAWPPAATGNPSLDYIGWFSGDVIAADVSAPGTASAGHEDLVVVHRVRQLGAGFGGDVGGAVVIRTFDPTTRQLQAPIYLDPTDMGSVPTHAAVADLTSDAHTAANGGLPGDGRDVPAGTPDIVVVNSGDNSLTFYLQVGPATSPATWVSCKLALSTLVPGLPPGDLIGVAIGDLSGDGLNEFVVVGQFSKCGFVFVHDRNPAAPGSLLPVPQLRGLIPFRLATVIALPAPNARRPSIADLSGDGRLDLAVPLFLNNDVALYINRGTVSGTPVFGDAPTYSPRAVQFSTNFGPLGSAVHDFNGDGLPDLAVGTLNQAASILLQRTPGTLDPAVPIPTGGGPGNITLGDMDGDGSLDLALSMQADNTVQRFRRDSSSLLALDLTIDLSVYADPNPPTLTVLTPQTTELVDLSGDGSIDTLLVSMFVVVGPGVNSGGWERMPMGGASVAAVRTTISTGIQAAGLHVQAGDFLYAGGVPDGIPDVVVASGDGLQLYAGQGGQSFANPQVLSAGEVISQVEVVDLDGDGHRDVVCAIAKKGVGVFYNGGHPAGSVAYGTLPATPVLLDLGGVPSNTGLLVRDLGHGSLRDIVFTNYSGTGVGILWQSSPRAFQATHLASGGEPGQVGVGDLNGDGLEDLAIPWGSDNVLAVYYRKATPSGLADTFSAPALFSTSQSPFGVVLFDVDGDGRADAVVSCRGANVLNVFRQR